MRLALVKVADNRHCFVWTRHHLLLDGWSTSQLMGEVLRCYAGETLPPTEGRYRDYIEWLQRRDADASEAYWRDQLQHLDAPTHLVSAMPKSHEAQVGHQEITLSLDSTTSATGEFRQGCPRNAQYINARCLVAAGGPLHGAR